MFTSLQPKLGKYMTIEIFISYHSINTVYESEWWQPYNPKYCIQISFRLQNKSGLASATNSLAYSKFSIPRVIVKMVELKKA